MRVSGTSAGVLLDGSDPAAKDAPTGTWRSLEVIGAPTPNVLPLVYGVNHVGTVSMYPRVFCECSCVRQGPYA